jgi:hypothetical protein
VGVAGVDVGAKLDKNYKVLMNRPLKILMPWQTRHGDCMFVWTVARVVAGKGECNGMSQVMTTMPILTQREILVGLDHHPEHSAGDKVSRDCI